MIKNGISAVVFCWLSLLAAAGFGQEVAWSLSYEHQLPVKLMATDKLQQLYVVTSANEIIKYRPDGSEQYRFSNNILGELTAIDVTDPFHVLLYYADYQRLITLDRTLNRTAELDLLDLNTNQVTAAGMSNDGHIWLYDAARFRLKKVDKTGAILLESQNLSLLLPEAPRPTQLVARDNWVYLADPAQGILVFSNFGQYIKTIDIQYVTRFQVVDNRLFFREDNQLVVYDLQSFRFTTLPLPQGTQAEDRVQMQRSRLFVQKTNGVLVYSLEK